MLALGVTGHAQVVEKKSLNLDGAKKAIIAAVDYAKKNNAPVLRSMEEYSISAVNLCRRDWRLLRRVAEARSDIRGGRPSVSKLIESLIDDNRDKLQAELS